MNMQVLAFNFDEKAEKLNFEVKFDFFHKGHKQCILNGNAKAIKRFHFTHLKDVVSIEQFEDFEAGTRFLLDHLGLTELFKCLNKFGLDFSNQ